ncbi:MULTISPECIES: TRAP transporter small permease subunit [Desulfobacula]|uniref:DctQ6: TRAP dicarboxylate transporter, presursor n=2 Tax=Desulfobacula TaxID=28222 RepID=K0NFL0_DESTT|nr:MULTISPECIES: TRAP transporter small permease [Desulfobacula]CCK79715.1 DctQ6: TRAP dicarboxylate transporter, presursor [Desulfobacula toluolica Tol2]SDU59334.1 TRAP-type mannitol/chloroaromatic compound transport system, small permease component [Desulfobacula phenolica]
MMNKNKGLTRIMDGIASFDEKLAEIAGWIVVLMMLTISYDVVMRYAFNSPTTWSFEVNRYMLIMVVFIGAAWTLPAGGHVTVDIATERIPERKRIVLDIITSFMAGTYVLIFLIQSVVFTYDALEHNVRSTEYLAWPLWPIRAFLVVGAALLFLEYILRIVRNFSQLSQTHEEK